MTKGRPLKQGVERTPSGAISRGVVNKTKEEKLVLEAALWQRQKRDASVTYENVCQPEHGNYWARLRRWSEQSERSDEVKSEYYISQEQYDTGKDIAALWHAMRPKNKSASDFSFQGGFDGRDPFDDEKGEALEQKFRKYRTWILESGPFGMTAVEAILVENKEMNGLVGDLRLACNNVANNINESRNMKRRP